MVVNNCLCGNKGLYRVEHGFLCKICYLRHIEEKFFKFVSKNKLINYGKKYTFVYDLNAYDVELVFLEKMFAKFEIGDLKIHRVILTEYSKNDFESLAKELKGQVIIMPNTVDCDCVLALKTLVEDKKFDGCFLPKFFIGKTEFVKPFHAFKTEELEQYSRIKKIPFKILSVKEKKYNKAIELLDSKYFIKRSFLSSVQNLSTKK